MKRDRTGRIRQKCLVGWKEWVALPGLGIPAIKAKVDTGARTSALHTFRVETFRSHGRERVRFWIHPLQRNSRREIVCEADVVDQRMVSDSSGNREMRYVIQTPLRLRDDEWDVEITLTNRDKMLFRMLLGRTALVDRAVVDPQASYLAGRKLASVYGKRKKKGTRQ